MAVVVVVVLLLSNYQNIDRFINEVLTVMEAMLIRVVLLQ